MPVCMSLNLAVSHYPMLPCIQKTRQESAVSTLLLLTTSPVLKHTP